MMPSKNEYYNALTQKIDMPRFLIATVVSLVDGKAMLQFQGDDEPVEKIFTKLSSYTPIQDEKVLVLSKGTQKIILGGLTK